MSRMWRSWLGAFCVFFGALWLAGCSTPDVSLYAKNQPTFNVQSFFNGPLTAHGILKNRSGEMIRYFNATLEGRWENGIGTLEEKFIFDDGEVQYRTWTLTPDAQGKYIATANDVVGQGIVNQAGNALFMKYVLQVPYDGDLIEVNVDDRMYMVKDGVVMNESVMTKFGFEVGYLSIVIQKVSDAS